MQSRTICDENVSAWQKMLGRKILGTPTSRMLLLQYLEEVLGYDFAGKNGPFYQNGDNFNILAENGVVCRNYNYAQKSNKYFINT